MEEKKIFIKPKKTIYNTLKFAFDGLIVAYKTEIKLWIYTLIIIVNIILSLFLKVSLVEILIGIVLYGMAIVAEMINTVIERIVDKIIPEVSNDAKFMKDVAAGAVLMVGLTFAIVELIIYIPRIIQIIGR
jgi:diacylglycerol kinase